MALYELRSSSIHGQGLFATKPITRGTRFISEKPLLVATARPGYLDYVELFSKFSALSDENKAEFLSLYTDDPHSTAIMQHYKEDVGTRDQPVQQTKQLHGMVEAVFKTCGIQIFPDLREFIPPLDNGPTAMAGLDSFEMNEVPQISNSAVQGHKSPEVAKVGVFLDACRLNHCCSPNAVFRWNDAIKQITVHARRDIDQDEEITLCSSDELNTLPTKDRSERLQGLFGFTCNCSFCLKASNKSNKRRKEMARLVDDLVFLLDHTHELEPGVLYSGPLAPSVVDEDGNKYPFTAIDKLSRLYEKEGVIDDNLGYWYCHAAEFSTFEIILDQNTQVEHWRRYLNFLTSYKGKDHPDFGAALETLHDSGRFHLKKLAREIVQE